jgi:hypothetical protein
LQEGEADMVSADTRAVIERAKRLYAEQLQAALEPSTGIGSSPSSRRLASIFLGTFDEAVKSTRAKDPSRLSVGLSAEVGMVG